jgi:hypothetical protein
VGVEQVDVVLWSILILWMWRLESNQRRFSKQHKNGRIALGMVLRQVVRELRELRDAGKR